MCIRDRRCGYEGRIVVLGCGNSSMSHALWSKGYRSVHSVDIDADIVQFMQAQHPELTWAVADLTDCQSELPDGSYDLALDKGTLDALLCVPHVADFLFEANRCLVLGGCYLLVSVLTSQELLQRIGGIAGLGFSGRTWELRGGRISVCELTKTGELSLIHI
eukprot:TRINITY_DN21802_c0_g1_i1.p1 TRINITY_DN21802_c0_g1~~TRINITY_DN21802_c0_g1_i1.p1  ORF type:complete len:162 (-),score=38.11 TRINITY_DN21802_c0_g1_i1:84-569(-)